MPDSYRDIADSVGLLGYWSANDLYEESDYVRCTCTAAAGAINEMRERLSAYDDAEEQGRLIILPCKVGDTVYRVVRHRVDVSGYRMEWEYETMVEAVKFRVGMVDAIGKTVFLAREEAETALRKGGVET